MKNKAIALMGAIVLCSLFFVALSATAIAAEEDDLVLGIYGNANEDDTIDMRDLTYVKLIFFGKKSETELADAKYDGKINPLDFIQIKLIIVGNEEELTVVDSDHLLQEARIVTVKMPVERVVVTYHATAAIIKALGIGAEDKVVGVASTIYEASTIFPELSELPSVGDTWAPDAESVIAREPDIVFTPAWGGETLAEQLEGTGITVFCVCPTDPLRYTEDVKKLAYILGEKDSGDDFIDWYEGYIDIIKDRTEGLSEEDKPQVFMTSVAYSSGNEWAVRGKDIGNPLIELAGGIRSTGDVPGGWSVVVDSEWVIVKNPDIALLKESPPLTDIGYDTDDPSEPKALRDEFMSHPGFDTMDAVKGEEVYVIAEAIYSRSWFIGAPYLAKWFHPELFEDLDPNAIHQEYLTRFQRIDYDLDEHGVFVYHPEKHPDGK